MTDALVWVCSGLATNATTRSKSTLQLTTAPAHREMRRFLLWLEGNLGQTRGHRCVTSKTVGIGTGRVTRLRDDFTVETYNLGMTL